MKYVNEDGKVRMLIAERHPFKGVKNYFTDSLLYQDSLETYKNPHLEEPDCSNEADMEPEEEEYFWEINSPIMSIDKLNFNTTANVKDEWFINENLDSVPSNTSTDVDSDPWSAMYALTSLSALIKSSLIVNKKIRDARKALFEVPAKRRVKS